MQFNNRFRQLIDDRQIGRKELAEQLNIAYSTLGNYLNGDREPDINMLIKIADLFSVSIDYLVGHPTNQTISDEETRLLHLFRQMPPEHQQMLTEIAKVMTLQNQK